MTREEFDDALLRFGADFVDWPEDIAEQARQLCARDPLAADLYKDFIAFEGTIAEAVRPMPFDGASIGAVLAALDDAEATWRPTPRFWIASAGASVFSFASGSVAMIVSFSSSGGFDLLLGLGALVMGQGDIGGLL